MFKSSGSNISSNRSNTALMVKVQRVVSKVVSILWESLVRAGIRLGIFL